MALSYKEKMAISQRLLEEMRLRLTGKSQAVLPPDGVVTDEDPVDISLVGGLAPRPDPDYHREQAPSAMGMVPKNIDTVECPKMRCASSKYNIQRAP